MKLTLVLLAALFLGVMPTFGAATKLICKNPGGGSGGPLEINLEDRIAYRYVQREQWSITSFNNDYVTMVRTKEVGGGIAVLDVATGKLQMVDVGLYCDYNVTTCTSGISTLQSFNAAAQTCSKSLVAD